ncbi:MAG TPA: SRPBCC family protein [Thermoanaerobaculia bacterium]|nr:SRPBCC family protein [Thermoanaerobaculia bacterium]
MTRIIIETRIAAPREVCFDLARDVDAHARSAAFSGERIVEPGRVSGLLETGDLVTFEGRHFGIRQRFTARIVEMRRPEFFIDEMVRGTFKWLRHIHEFEERGGDTLMRDTLEWRAPLGFIADPLFLRRHMHWFVATKQRALKELAETLTAASRA